MIETPLLNDVLEQMFGGDIAKGQKVVGGIASQERLGQPREVGTVVSFLLSDDASYVNGVAWPIDGGALATIRH
ncbi:MAG: SDR family oxidoreductase [Sphingomonas sp.]